VRSRVVDRLWSKEDDKWLIENYKQLTNRELGMKFGVSKGAITARLHRIDAPLRDDLWKDRKEKSKNITYEYLYDNYVTKKKTQSEIGEEIGVSPQCISRKMKRFNIPIRDRSTNTKLLWDKVKRDTIRYDEYIKRRKELGKFVSTETRKKMSETRKGKFRVWTNKLITDTIKNLYLEGKPLNIAYVSDDKHSALVSSAKSKVHFGSWRNAVEFAGIDYDEVLKLGYVNRNILTKKWNKESVIEKILKFNEVGIPLSDSFINHNHTDLYRAGLRYCDNWRNAIRLAGLNYNEIKEGKLKRIKNFERVLGIPFNDYLNQQYWGNNKSISRIAHELGVDGTAVLTYMKEFEIPRRNPFKIVYEKRDMWGAWETLCEEIARVVYGDIQTQKINGGSKPDIFISSESIAIDAKLSSYQIFYRQIKNYQKISNRMEFWCLFNYGNIVEHPKVKYLFADDLINILLETNGGSKLIDAINMMKEGLNPFDGVQRKLT